MKYTCYTTMYTAVVRKQEEKTEWFQKEVVFYEIYANTMVTAKPGKQYEMEEYWVGGLWQKVCIYGQRYIVKDKKWEDHQMPMRGKNDKYFRKFGTAFKAGNDAKAKAVEYLQEIMRKQDENAPEIKVDNKKYIYMDQYYPFTLPEKYAKLKL